MCEDNWAHLDAVMGLKRRVCAYSVRAGSFSSQFSIGVIQFLCNAVVVQRSTLRPLGSRLHATVTDLVGGASRDLCATVTVPKNTKTSSVLHCWIPVRTFLFFLLGFNFTAALTYVPFYIVVCNRYICSSSTGTGAKQNKHRHIYMYAGIALTTWFNGIRHVA